MNGVIALYGGERVVTVCCSTHRPDGCCDPDDCGPCCLECPTCADLRSWTPERRREAAVEMRARQAEFAARLADEAARTDLAQRRAFHTIVAIDLDEHLSDLDAATRAAVRALTIADFPLYKGRLA